MTYAKGDKIFEQGKIYSFIAVVLEGSCRLERKLPLGETIYFLTHSPPLEVHGDTCFLLNEAASCSLVASEGEVRALLITGNFLRADFIRLYPSLVAAFYFHLCRCLSDRSHRQLEQLQ